jgi:hypothetical protein
MTQERILSPEAAAAEREALERQQAEERAEERFDAVRAALAASGRAHEATTSREFHDWMATRHRTDEAWGRWALAMDAAAAAQ